MTMTELLERVDWSLMTDDGEIRHENMMSCPITAAVSPTLDSVFVWNVVTEKGLSALTACVVVDAADNNFVGDEGEFINPAVARWRQWMLERMAAAKG